MKNRKTLLKNYSTTASADKSIMEIEYLLTQYGCSDIWKKFEDGQVIAINFVLETSQGKLPFQLPVRILAIREMLKDRKKKGKARGITKQQSESLEHARKVGWKILRDWLESQLVLVEMEMVKLEEIMLPYIYDHNQGKTLFEAFEEEGFQGLPLKE